MINEPREAWIFPGADLPFPCPLLPPPDSFSSIPMLEAEAEADETWVEKVDALETGGVAEIMGGTGVEGCDGGRSTISSSNLLRLIARELKQWKRIGVKIPYNWYFDQGLC